MRVRKIIIRSAAAALLAVAALFGFAYYDAWHRFAVEDEIHATFYPLATALYLFEEKHGTPATNLAQLVPDYISAIPASRLVSSLDYTLLDDGKTWQLAMHSRALDQPRVYCCRSTQDYSADEQRRMLGKYHGCWVVLTE
jgi:hypothetical protein